jgi:hypothetical protein
MTNFFRGLAVRDADQSPSRSVSQTVSVLSRQAATEPVDLNTSA